MLRNRLENSLETWQGAHEEKYSNNVGIEGDWAECLPGYNNKWATCCDDGAPWSANLATPERTQQQNICYIEGEIIKVLPFVWVLRTFCMFYPEHLSGKLVSLFWASQFPNLL